MTKKADIAAHERVKTWADDGFIEEDRAVVAMGCARSVKADFVENAALSASVPRTLAASKLRLGSEPRSRRSCLAGKAVRKERGSRSGCTGIPCVAYGPPTSWLVSTDSVRGEPACPEPAAGSNHERLLRKSHPAQDCGKDSGGRPAAVAITAALPLYLLELPQACRTAWVESRPGSEARRPAPGGARCARGAKPCRLCRPVCNRPPVQRTSS